MPVSTRRPWLKGLGRPRPIAIRRGLGIFVLLVAATLAAADLLNPDSGYVRVFASARELQAGKTIEKADIVQRDFPRDLVPKNALREEKDLVGKTVALPVSAGELISHNRLVSSQLAEELTGEQNSKIVAVTPAEAGVVAVLHAGDLVDIIAGETEKTSTAPLAHGARVVNIIEEEIVLIALPSGAAELVATASLDSPLTLLITG